MKLKYSKIKKLNNLKELISVASEEYSDRTAFKELDDNRQILEYSFKRLENDINALGTAMLDIGMKNHHIAVIGANSYNWVISYLTVICGVGVVIPIDKELDDDSITNLLQYSDTDAVIFTKTYADTVKNAMAKCTKLTIGISMDTEDDEFITIDELITMGNALRDNGDSNYTSAAIDNSKMSEIVFTSGTTGINKGVMLSHKNLCAVIYGALSYIKPKGISFCVLPMSHTYEFSCHILGGIYSGLTICINDSLKHVSENLKLFKPSFSVMVPLFLESIHRKIWKQAVEDNLDKHLKYGIWFSNFIRKFGFDLRRLYFKPVIDSFGGNLTQIISGGAPLRDDIAKDLTDLGIDILNGYGITECAPLVSVNSLHAKRRGSVGKVIPGCTVKILNSNKNKIGEILIKGDNVMLGYYKDEVSTQKAFTENGWFITGDLGRLSRRNFLYINGRAKNLIILSNGKNVHPEELEQLIADKIPYVKEVMVYASTIANSIGECINASIYVDNQYFTNQNHTSISNRLNQDIKSLNKNLPGYKRITNLLLRDSEFEKTSTKKIKRHKNIQKEYSNA